MKRIEAFMKIVSAIVLVCIVGILAFAGTRVYNDMTSGDFIGTPAVSVEAVEAQAEKNNLILVFFAPGDEANKVLKPDLTEHTQSFAASDASPRTVFVSTKDPQNIDLINKFHVDTSKLPLLVPVAKGGSTNVVISNPEVLSKSIGVESLTNAATNSKLLDVYFAGTWEVK